MYAQQSSIDPSLAALLQTAQMVTPDQTPTVAAQVAQAAQQKMQPQGIMQGMPQARQDYANAAPSMMRNMQQQQMQQMVRQAMQPQPAGIEGLPAPNMQGMAEGGVVGFASRGYVNPEFPEVYETTEADLYPERLRESAKRKQEEEERRKKLEFLETVGAPQATQYREPTPIKPSVPAPQLTVGNAPPMAPEAQRLMDRQRVPAPRPPAPAPRPPAPPAEPQSGIAQLVAPTPESAMASARSTLGLGDTSSLRAKEAAYLEALKAQPAKGQQGLAALQAQQSDLQRMYDKAEKESNINSVIQQLLGRGEGPGGSARASMAFSEREDARRRTYGELQVANATKRDAIIDLQNARDAGNAKAALEAEQRIRQADLAIAKAEGDWAGHIATSQANVYGTQVRSENEAANRANAIELERLRRATASMPGETERILAEFNRRKAKDPADAEQYLQNIERIKGLGKPTDRAVLTYAQAAKIVDERLSEPQTAYALMNEEVAAAKKEGRQPRSRDQIREALIRREVQMAGGGGPAASPTTGGTVDRNNPLLK